MATITDTSILHWLPFDSEGELLKLALINADIQTWNSTDLKNGTSIHELMMVPSKQRETNLTMASPAQLGLATGLLLSLLINSRIWTAKANKKGFGSKLLFGNDKPYHWILHLTPSSSFTFAYSKTFILPYLYLLPFLALILLMPILSVLAVFLLPFAIYRLCVYAYLKHQKSASKGRQEETKLFPGADAVWAFNESYQSYSVINALILLEGKPNISSLRRILSNRLGAFPKLRMRRSFTMGYATWTQDPDLDLGNLVRWLPGKWGNSAEESRELMEGLQNISSEKWNRNNLSRIVENLCNVPLPCNHTTSWEARVGRAMPWEEVSLDEMSATNEGDCQSSSSSTVFPILFRIHHSVGDGASLLQLLMSTLIDSETQADETRDNISDRQPTKSSSSLSRPLKFQTIPKLANSNNPTEESKPETDNPKIDLKIGDQSIHYDSKNKASTESSKNLNKLPANSSSYNAKGKGEGLSNDKESSFLYGRRLSGKKMIYWDSNSVTVGEVKKIRAATGVKFTEILLSGISAALAGYWEARNNGDFDDLSDGTKTSAKNKRPRIQKKAFKSDRIAADIEDSDALEDVMEESEKEGCHTKTINGSSTNTLKNKEQIPPPSVKLVLPAILGSLFQKPKISTSNGCNELENLFSVAVMKLPVGKTGVYPLERLYKISDAAGYMMPLRKDSIVDCKRKSMGYLKRKISIAHYSTSTDKAAECETVVSGESGTMLSHSYEEDAVNVNPSMRGKPAVEREVLYYTAKETDPQISFSSKKPSSVQYCKEDNSAEVVISNEEPYTCPTAIFFTKYKRSDVCSGKEEEVSMNEGAACIPAREKIAEKQKIGNREILGENTDKILAPKTETDKECLNKIKDANNSIDPGFDKKGVTGGCRIEELPSGRSSLTLPSSPTIQHLLTRWLALDIVATILPSLLAAPMMSLASNGVALVMSNLPGPPKRVDSVLGGHPMKEIVFWAPHRGYTGVGITIISYDGRLHIGLMADEAVVPTRRGAQFIMNAILDELHSLEAAVSTSC